MTNRIQAARGTVPQMLIANPRQAHSTPPTNRICPSVSRKLSFTISSYRFLLPRSVEMPAFSSIAYDFSPSFIVSTVVLLCVIAVAVRNYLAYRRLAHFKGPFWAAWTELWLARVTWQSRIHTALRDVNEQYGRETSILDLVLFWQPLRWSS